MYLLEIGYDNARETGRGRLSLRCDRAHVRKWTLLGHGAGPVEVAQLVALASLGRTFLHFAARYTPALVRPGATGLDLECRIVRHPPRDCQAGAAPITYCSMTVRPDGQVQPMDRSRRRLAGREERQFNSGLGSGIRQHLALAYGPRWAPRSGQDRFDFPDPHAQRFQRVQSVFDPDSRLTDAPSFLQRLHYRKRKGRLPAIQTLERLADRISQHLGVPTDRWLESDADFASLWNRIPATEARILLPVIDAVRHVTDASPHDLDPLARPGVAILVHPQRSCPPHQLAAWFELFDRLFPALQFVVVASKDAAALLPARVSGKRLAIPQAPHGPPDQQAPSDGRARRQPPVRLGTDAILLVDVDGRIPNLALMKLGGWLRGQGRDVVLARLDGWRGYDAEQVYASCVFRSSVSQRRVGQLRQRFGDRLSIGGSGVDLVQRLPAEVEDAFPDYGLYSVLGDRALGFLTRGCPRRCSYCIVPEKEGLPRQVSGLKELLQGRRKLVLLDDNLLAHPRADVLLEQMARGDIRVNFNQTLDISLVDRERAALLRRIDCANYGFTRRNYHFSLNDVRNLDRVARNYAHFGFGSRENVEFICMYGFDTTLREDLERFRFLRSLPGAYVFVQEYQPPPGKRRPGLDGFFDAGAYELIEELIQILFPQNMKSMEKYYRWLSQRFLEAYGELHAPLVDTIFRYNHRDRKGLYISRMLQHRDCERA